MNSATNYRQSTAIVQFFRSLLTAWAAFFVDWAVLEILVAASGGQASLLKVFSYPAALATTYVLSRFWVFGNPKRHRAGGELLLYLAGAVVALGISSSTIWILSDSLALLHFRFSNALGMALVFLWNFVYRKHIVFPGKTRHNFIKPAESSSVEEEDGA